MRAATVLNADAASSSSADENPHVIVGRLLVFLNRKSLIAIAGISITELHVRKMNKVKKN